MKFQVTQIQKENTCLEQKSNYGKNQTFIEQINRAKYEAKRLDYVIQLGKYQASHTGEEAKCAADGSVSVTIPNF